MVRIGGLWKNKAKSGISYLSGNLGAGRILIFPNRNKERDGQPDYELFIDGVAEQTNEGDI